jgi:putative SOS response-associated peptidase YedK
MIYRKDGNPLLLAAIWKPPFENGNAQEGFLIVTAAADEGLLDIHDRRPLVYSPDAARKWLSENTIGNEAEDIAREVQSFRRRFHMAPRQPGCWQSREPGPGLIEPLA